MNISKSEILNPESGDNAAVKLALAETHIIQETKTYLESQGVLLSSFSSRARSDTTILVKNIPYGTTIEQIRELFEPHGELSRVLVPPAGTMAVVEFERPDEAAKGFRAVAYRRLGNSVIYLEKGPLGMFDERLIPTGKDSSSKPPTISSVIRVPEQSIADLSKPADSDQDVSIQHGTTLYLKNLAFSTTQDRLVKVFSHLPSFSFARVQTKPDPKRPGERLSMGYGFIGFKDTEGAKKALKSIHDFVLDGHALHVSFAGRGADESESKSTDPTTTSSTTTKMIVKNVPFEATKKDVRALFGYVYTSFSFMFLFSLIKIQLLFLSLVPMANSNLFDFPRNSTLGHAVSHFLNLYLGMKQRMHMRRYAIRIFLVDIWFWSGRRKLSEIWKC